MTVLALLTDAPFRVRFAISKPSLETFAKTASLTEDKPIDSCRWVGLYYMCWAYRYETASGVHFRGGATLSSREWAIETNTGFVYLPKGRPEETLDDSYRHLGGPWYGWHGWDSW
ncbi:hypothetical protein HNP84_008355 [Thermocatellispora tengchongensis]|uniref:Uncharacterized protein n=1 Tax=Thermocatellispora tengchongensis TaxID=1073253 RepID=A0A840PLD0_9ACTN|nr:hypothetical protein [Thermocatellispora tengchongensis]MBB5138601.1 hypothetical protein [Thermocatellispora tengchongensis]